MIVAIIGSSRFKAQQLGIAQRETLRGNIVLLTGFWHHVDMVPITDEQKAMLDELTRKKIAMADVVFVVNVNGYVGKSTQDCIDYAIASKKSIEYLEPIGQPKPLSPRAGTLVTYVDAGGVQHHNALVMAVLPNNVLKLKVHRTAREDLVVEVGKTGKPCWRA